MKTKDVIELAGGGAALARLLGITHGAICQWGNDVPEKRVWQLKVLRPKWLKRQPTADDRAMLRAMKGGA